MAQKESNLITWTGSFNGFQRKEYTDSQTGEIKISKRFKLQLLDEVMSTDDELATYELYFRVPEDLSIPRMMPGQSCTVQAQMEQDKSHENWRCRLVSVVSNG